MSKHKTEGIKYDQDKVDFSLVPPAPLTEVARVWTFGKLKYSAWNWTKGFTWSRPYAAALRHIFLWARGQTNDPETGLHHLAHAICCLMMIIEFEFTNGGEDDRFISAPGWSDIKESEKKIVKKKKSKINEVMNGR